MPESSSLTDGCLIEDVRHAADEIVVVSGFAYVDAALRGVSNEVPSARFDLVLPPVVEALNRKRSDGLKFFRGVKSRFNTREPLPESENIDLGMGIPQSGEHRFWILHVLIPFLFEAEN